MTMQKTRAPSASAFVNIAGNACTTAVSLIHVRCDRRASIFNVSRARWLTARCADSESRFLATKIFLGPLASCLGLTAQKRRSCESCVADSQHEIWRARRANEKFERDERRAM